MYTKLRESILLFYRDLEVDIETYNNLISFKTTRKKFRSGKRQRDEESEWRSKQERGKESVVVKQTGQG